MNGESRKTVVVKTDKKIRKTRIATALNIGVGHARFQDKKVNIFFPEKWSYVRKLCMERLRALRDFDIVLATLPNSFTVVSHLSKQYKQKEMTARINMP